MSPASGLRPALVPRFRELGDLKRIFSAERPGSIAERLFRDAWAALVRGENPDMLAMRTVAAALAAARLGDLDRATLLRLGLSPGEAEAVLARALREIAGETSGVDGVLDGALVERLAASLQAGGPEAGAVPDFVERLCRQPRAGVTAPGQPRIMLQPAENHGEHCLAVAVYGVLMAPAFGADPAEVFVASLAHHLHNAAMPDSGFSGEVLLGDRLDDVITRARDAALDQIAEPLRRKVADALAPIGGDDTAEARAFHAADVADRVLEIEQHLSARAVTMDVVLGDYGLVHDGPVKSFHDRVLEALAL